jgi:hypothetical protein
MIGQYLVSAEAFTKFNHVFMTRPGGTSPRKMASPATDAVNEAGSNSFSMSNFARESIMCHLACSNRATK